MRKQDLLDADLVTAPPSDELLDLDEALSKLAQVDARAAEVVKLRVFAGMTIDGAAVALRVSPATAKRAWSYARAWLRREIKGYNAC
jgi:DNA-directed RNA polymerase specialized sigma24 family protein